MWACNCFERRGYFRKKAIREIETLETTSTKDQSFRFLDLPPELRHGVYEYALVADDPIPIMRFELNCDCLSFGVCTWMNKKLAEAEGQYCNGDGTHHQPCSQCGEGVRIMAEEPALLLVCRTIRNEALGIYFGDNVFVNTYGCGLYHDYQRHRVKHEFDWQTWLEYLGPRRVAMLREVRLSIVSIREVAAHYRAASAIEWLKRVYLWARARGIQLHEDAVFASLEVEDRSRLAEECTLLKISDGCLSTGVVTGEGELWHPSRTFWTNDPIHDHDLAMGEIEDRVVMRDIEGRRLIIYDV